MASYFSLLERVEPVTFALSNQGAQCTQVKRCNKLSITILVNPQISSKNAKFKVTQKGLRIGSICQFWVNLGIIRNYLQSKSEMFYFF